MWWVKNALDLGAIAGSLSAFLGLHDYKAFADARMGDASTRVKVDDLRVTRHGELLLIRIGASHFLAGGMGTVAVAGGMENMTLAPYLLPKARDGYRIGHQQVIDSMITDGLWDPYNNIHMGNCAEQCAAKYKFSREQQDA